MSKPLQIYEDRHNIKFPNNTIKVINKVGKEIYFQTEFGLCKKLMGEFGRTSFGVTSAINKTEFLQNQFNKIHKNKYNYLEIHYLNGNSKIKIECRKHGIFEQKVSAHLNGHGCKKCGAEAPINSTKFNKEDFLEKANLKHNSKYDYSNAIYSNSIIKVTIICPVHGEFSQIPNSHLQGYGCPKCGFEFVGKINSKNPTGWSLTEWIKSSKTSKNFDSFKVYIIKCWNEEEEFYKIGRTFLKINKRFSYIKALPYKYEIIQVFEGEAEEIFKLETELKNKNKNNKYIPKIKFHGMQECFLKLN